LLLLGHEKSVHHSHREKYPHQRKFIAHFRLSTIEVSRHLSTCSKQAQQRSSEAFLNSRKAKVIGHERKNETESKEEPWAGQRTILTIEVSKLGSNLVSKLRSKLGT
jgi:hypothetical protein